VTTTVSDLSVDALVGITGSSSSLPMIDWGAGHYERTAAELDQASVAVVERAAVQAGDDVLDLACGTGNAALHAAALGARVIGVDGAPRLLEVARSRADAAGLEIDFRDGDLLALPVDAGSADAVLSVFGVIFASDPPAALGEVARVLRPDGRALVTAWVPAGPIDAVLTATGRAVAAMTGQERRQRFPWFDGDRLGPLAAEAGLVLVTTASDRLAIRAGSVREYMAGTREHPMSIVTRPLLEGTDAGAQVAHSVFEILSEANEDPDAFLVHSPYVVHELRRA